MPPPTYSELQQAVTLMFALLLILACLALDLPESKPKAAPDPTCKLHQTSESKCRSQHDDPEGDGQ